MLIQFALYKYSLSIKLLLLLLLLLLKFASITKKVLLRACRIYLLNSHTYPCNDDNTRGRWPKPSEEGGGGGELPYERGGDARRLA